MSSSNSINKEQQKKKAANEGIVALEPSNLAKFQAIATDSSTDSALAAFAAAIPSAAAQSNTKTQAFAVKRLAQEAFDYSIKGDCSIGASMIELLCDVVLSPRAQPLHKPVLGALKTLPSTSLASMHSYLTQNLLEIIENRPLWDITYSVKSLLVFPEHRPAIAACAMPIALNIVSSLEKATEQASRIDNESVMLSISLSDDMREQLDVIHSLLNVLSTQCCSLEDVGAPTRAEGLEVSVETDLPEEKNIGLENEEQETDSKPHTSEKESPIGTEEMKSCICRIARCLLDIFRHKSLPKETMAASAVCLCSAIAFPDVNPAAVAAEMVAGLLLPSTERLFLVVLPEEEEPLAADLVAQGWVGDALREQGTTLPKEFRKVEATPALCLLRGVLQGTHLAAVITPLKIAASSDQGTKKEWSLLADGALTNLCRVIPSALDANFRYLALHTLTICLDRVAQQWQAGASKNPSKENQKQHQQSDDLSKETSATTPVLLSEAQQRAVLGVLWSCWDDAAPHITRLAHSAFGQLLKLAELQRQYLVSKHSGNNKSSAASNSFVVSVAQDLLALGPEQKRRYAPLAAIVPHLGAGELLTLRPTLVEETLGGMAMNRSCCTPAMTMLSVLWSSLRNEAAAKKGVESSKSDPAAALEAVRPYWAPQLAAALFSNNEASRQIASSYAVPAVAEIDPGAVEILLGKVAVEAPSQDIATAAVVALLSIGRKLHIINDLTSIKIPSSIGSTLETAAATTLDVGAVLRCAITHRSDTLRSGALNLACVHPKTTALPTAEELMLVEEALKIDFRTTSPAVRQNTIAPLGRLLMRIRVSAGAILHRPRDFPPGSIEEVARCEAWLRRFAAGVVASIYPAAQYSRKFMALDTICMFLEVFGDCLLLNTASNSEEAASSTTGSGTAANTAFNSTSEVNGLMGKAFRRKGPLAAAKKRDGGGGSVIKPGAFNPFPESFYAAETVNALLGCMLDSWDKIREAAGEALLLLPAPMPGLARPEEVAKLLQVGLQLLASPRLKDADAGARMVLLVFQQFVVGLGWRCSVHPPVAYISNAKHSGYVAILDFLVSMVALVSSRIEAGEADLEAASRESLAHGPLLALRYILPAVPWDELLANKDTCSSAQAVASKLLAALQRLNDLLLPVLSTPETMTKVSAADVDVVAYLSFDNAQVEGGTFGSSGGGAGAGDSDAEEEGEEVLGPEAQVITCACWMSAKELALVIGTLSQVAPIVLPPTSLATAKAATSGIGGEVSAPLLSPNELASAGDMLIRCLIEAKHNGAVDKTEQGLEALAAVIMGAAPSTHLPEVPSQWLSRLLQHLRRSGQSHRDIIRRSSGLPYAIQALLRARPAGGLRVLAARGFQELLTTADAEDLPECWPRVHAFNALRMAFADTELGLESQPFQAQGLQVAIKALAAPQWEVRNAAMLCYTTLLIRMLGFANLGSRNASGKRAVTAADFFAAHPTLHPFLLAQLQRAAEDLEAGAKDLHPSLSPILTLLMRMNADTTATGSSTTAGVSPTISEEKGSPAPSAGEAGTMPALLTTTALGLGSFQTSDQSSSSPSSSVLHTSPQAFIPLVQRCAAARPMAVRQQAAKALAPLVPLQALASVAGTLAQDIAQSLKQGPLKANKVQGQLLQLVELVKMLEGTIVGAQVAGTLETEDGSGGIVADVLGSITPPLKSCAAVCTSSRFECAPISHAFLRLASAMASLVVSSSNNSGAAVSFILAASEHAQRGIQDSMMPSTSSNNEVMLGVALKEATLLRLLWTPLVINLSNHQVSNKHQDWVEEVSLALQHSRSEVRASALKATLRFLGVASDNLNEKVAAALSQARPTVLSVGDQHGLRAVLGVHITRETHAKTLRRALQALSLLMSPSSASPHAGDAAAGDIDTISFDEMAQHAQHAPDPIIRCYALSCLGSLQSSSADSPEAATEAATLARLASEMSQPHQIPELRIAAVKMLSGSNLLEFEDNSSSSMILHVVDAWDAVMCLSDDDDLEVREEAAQRAALAMSRLDVNESQKHILALAPQDLCVEKVRDSVLPALAKRFGANAAMLSMLCRRTCNVAAAKSTLKEALNAAAASEEGALKGRLFEIESDNHNEEPLLQAQMAAMTLATTVSEAGSSDEVGDVLSWAHKAAVTLRELNTLLGWSALTGIASVVQLETAFLPAYCLVLALWAAGHCPSNTTAGNRKEIVACIKELNSRKAFSSGLGAHPLLRGLWAAAVHRWLGSPASRGGGDSPLRRTPTTMLIDPAGFLLNVIGTTAPSDDQQRGFQKNLLEELERHEASAAGARAGQGGGPALHCTIS